MKRTVLIFCTSLFFCLLFFCFSVLVKKGFFTKIDFDTTVRLQNHTPVKLDRVFPVFGILASLPVMTLILLVVLFLFRKWTGVLVLFLFFIAHGVELFGKLFINHPPPPFLFYKHLDAPEFQLQKYYVSGGSSYPSGHEFRTVFVCIVLLFFLTRMRKIPTIYKILCSSAILAITVLVGVSRISLGEHWTSDV